MTVKVTFVTKAGRKLKQSFAGCIDIEDGKYKCLKVFPGAKIKEAEEVKEKEK